MSGPFPPQKLPVSVICPVRDCRVDLPLHAAHLRTLAPLVEEMLVVDSHSTDGTLEYLQEALADTGACFLDHPPGLYPSWNHAIAQATQPYLTIATVGDPLPAHSLLRLHETMEKLEADVVISAPRFTGADGKACDFRWPIHEFLEMSGMQEPMLIPTETWMLFTFLHLPATLLSSSAGNLYRTRLLQQHPFPTIYGHSGDSVWALEMGMEARWVIDPKVESYFRLHDEADHKEPISPAVVENIRRTSELSLLRYREKLQDGTIPAHLWEELIASPSTCAQLTLIKKAYRAMRKPYLPWFLHPKALRLRRTKKNLLLLKRKRRELLRDYTRRVVHQPN